jgi:hypothetical protein
MPPPPDVLPPEVLLWCGAPGAALMREVIALLGPSIRVIAVGAPTPAPGSGADLAREWGCACSDDLRQLLIDHPAAFVFLATAEGVEDQDILSASAAGATVLSLQPLAASFDQWARLHPRGAANLAGPGFLVPAFMHCPGWRSAADPREALPAPRSLSFASLGPPGQGSLFARLYDAWHVLLTLADLPETIDASLTSASAPAPEDLRYISGSLSAHARLPHGRAATLQISDRAPRHARRLLALGEAGQLKVHDSCYELLDAKGEVIDAHPAAAEPPTFAALVVHHWRQFLDQPAAAQSASAPGREREALACCLACLLSSRTGQPESPGQLLDLRRHG